MDLVKISKKWQKKWQDAQIFKVSHDFKKKKFYVLEMYCYPSSHLHMGHLKNYSLTDASARYKRLKGFNVLYPTGYDSFGLPAENAAIKYGDNPKDYTERNIARIREQQKAIGWSYDWSREIASHRLDYTKWDQYFFLKLFEKDLAYRNNAPVNFCPSCKTVLANEQVENGTCWRCHSNVETKLLEQWFLRITKYADELLEDLEVLDWPDRVKVMQKNWISRKEWIDIDYQIDGSDKKIKVSTTRPDTNFGATFIVIAPEHSLVNTIPSKNKKEVNEYITYAKDKTEEDRIKEGGKKTGVFTGLYCINLLTKNKMPIWVADFVLASVGTGAVVGVPGHDLRDFDFAKEFDIPIVRVVVGDNGDKSEINKREQVYEGKGKMINSGFLNGLDTDTASKKVMDYFEKNNCGKRIVRYRLRDWLLSRQRYWGAPIPIIHCKSCGVVPVPESELPVELPKNVEFTGKGNPLEYAHDFVNVTCPKCDGPAKRETDTLDTFFDSSWYFLRFCDPQNNDEMFNEEIADYWMPVDQYIGGIEHAILHLLYARFITKTLRDLGFTTISEPFKKLYTIGMIIKDGAKMSKSLGNVVDPMQIAETFGPDTARLFILSAASYDKELEWSDKGVEAANKFIKRFASLISPRTVINNTQDKYIENHLNLTIKEVTECMEKFELNIAATKLMSFTNYLNKYRNNISDDVFNKSLMSTTIMFSPFIPHVCEEIWHEIGGKNFVSISTWPLPDDKKVDPNIKVLDLMIEQVSRDIHAVLSLVKIKPKNVTLFVSESWKYSLFSNLKTMLNKTRNPSELIKAVMIKEHAKEIPKIVNDILKNPAKIPAVMVSKLEELEALERSIEFFSKEIKLPVAVIDADKSKEQKAAQACPGKPAILIE